MKKDLHTAFLILAHNQPAHLNRIIKALNHESFRFFIHIDAKSDISMFEQYTYPRNVHFLKKRENIFRAGYSMVDAMILLLKEAINDPAIDYFYFLSGWDYPIKSSAGIHDFLSQNYPTNFISFYPLVGSADFVNNIRKYFFIDSIGQAPGIISLPLKIVQRILQNWPVNRNFFQEIIPFRGSAWFCINRRSVSHIIEFLEKPESMTFVDYFHHVYAADEIFFHTIILNSACAGDCNLYPEYLDQRGRPIQNENKAYLHYIDWDQSRENPALLDKGDYEKIYSSGALFARKFHEQKSAELLDAIDRMTGNYG